MTAATKVILIAEKYYAKLWLGDGDAPDALDFSGTYPTDITANKAYFADPVAKTTLYSKVTPTPSAKDDYVGKYVEVAEVIDNTTIYKMTLVTEDNKDGLSITAGTTNVFTPLSNMPLPITPQLGWFYLDATTGKLYVYCGDDTTPWTEAGTWTGGFL